MCKKSAAPAGSRAVGEKINIFLTLAAVYDLELGSMDLKTAFLNAPLEEKCGWNHLPHFATAYQATQWW